jgi:hypothetical protein
MLVDLSSINEINSSSVIEPSPLTSNSLKIFSTSYSESSNYFIKAMTYSKEILPFPFVSK